MKFMITHIDFDSRCVYIEVGPQHTGKSLDTLVGLLAECRTHGFDDTRVHCETGMTNLQMVVINEMCEKYGAQIVTGDLPVHELDGRNHLWTCSDPAAMEDPDMPARYCMEFLDMDNVSDRIGAAMMLIGSASRVDPTTTRHMRLCGYELATNTVEHGSSTREKEISVTVDIFPTEIGIRYSDTADPFVTMDGRKINVGEKIKRGEKRGLGLFILNKLAKSMTYERLDDTNVTELLLASRTTSSYPNRRRTMDGISVEMIPCDIEHTVIMKPIGSIDSTTTRILDSQISGVMTNDAKRIVIDFSETDFISSAGVGIFLGTVAQLRSAGGDLIFMNVPSHIQEVFDIINLASYFQVVSSIDDLKTVKK